MSRLPEDKKRSLDNALTRNLILTSSYDLENVTMTVYKEGFRIKFEGCRSSFSVYAADHDGEFIITRKPAEKKLHKLYEQFSKTWQVIDLSKCV